MIKILNLCFLLVKGHGGSSGHESGHGQSSGGGGYDHNSQEIGHGGMFTEQILRLKLVFIKSYH